MRAIIWTRYGPPSVLELREIDKPMPKEGEVLVKVHAATVTMGDCEVRRLKLPAAIGLPMRVYIGWTKPSRITILGQELAGVVEAVGKGVTQFKLGDEVFAPTFFKFGAYAEYKCLPESYPRVKPKSMTLEEAATIPTGGINALHFMQRAKVTAGEKVLINGAGGSIGTYALQIAKAWGAEVTGVDSGEKMEMLRSLGADEVIDYAQEDFTKRGETYDVILDVVGKSDYAGAVRALKPKGRYILGNPNLGGMVRAGWTTRTTDKRVTFDMANYEKEAFAFLIGMIEEGKVKAVIDRRFPLEKTAEAHEYVEAGHKKGNVIITVG